MRWKQENADFGIRDDDTTPTKGPEIPLFSASEVLRKVRTPEFADVTFHEVLAKSALNKVPSSSEMPFGWTINPYRGCSHACVYCFARNTHTYLDFDAGADFDSQVVVKVNVAEVLRTELAKPSWQRNPVALGTNTDPYQRAEGRYRLMPGIIGALVDSGTPFSILTKGTLLSRDIPLLAEARKHVSVSVSLSLAMVDSDLATRIEPGTPSPAARLGLIAKLREAGIACGVMATPVLPWLNDSDEALRALFSDLKTAGATGVTAMPLFLRPGTRQWYLSWLGKQHPELVVKYEQLYYRSSYAHRPYRDWLREKVQRIRREIGFGSRGAMMHFAKRADRSPSAQLGHSGAVSRNVANAERVHEPTLF